MNNKDTIYIDIDDEITTIIDKVQNADNKIVALVLPKRATVLQSIVNMKLLKRSAETAKKQVVLITSEAGLLPLAASVGFYVASTLQSKPTVPTLDDDSGQADDEAIEEESVNMEDFDTKANAAATIGALSGDEPASATDEPESIELDNTEAEVSPTTDKTKADKSKKSDDGKKLAVPNFLRFRKRFLLIAAALVLLIGGGVVCAVVLPKATITIKADASTIVVDKTLTLSTQQQGVNSNDGILPASLQQVEKKSTQQVDATGQKNIGTKASGQVTITNCTNPAKSVKIPAGTGVSSNGLTFVTQADVSINFSSNVEGGCTPQPGFSSKSVDVVAVNNGTQYNVDSTTFNVAGFSSVKAQSSDKFTGGTDNIVKVVSQSDIDGAKQKMNPAGTAADGARSELQEKLAAAGYQAILETFAASEPAITSSVNVNDQADTVTVTQSVNYKMFGVKKTDLASLISTIANSKIDTNTQSILKDGLDKATYSLLGNVSDSSVQIKFRSEAMAGPKIDVEGLKKQLAGQKRGQIQANLKALPGVEDVSVDFSPFWVNSVPKNASKVTVNFEQVSGGTNGQ